MKKLLVIAAASGALALGVPAAFAVTDDTPQTPTQPVQQESTPTPAPQPQERGDDCPEKNGDAGAAAAGAQL